MCPCGLEKSNEITAVPELLDLLDIENCILTADAMSCQKTIAAKIVEKHADYVLSVKEMTAFENSSMSVSDVM